MSFFDEADVFVVGPDFELHGDVVGDDHHEGLGVGDDGAFGMDAEVVDGAVAGCRDGREALVLIGFLDFFFVGVVLFLGFHEGGHDVFLVSGVDALELGLRFVDGGLRLVDFVEGRLRGFLVLDALGGLLEELEFRDGVLVHEFFEAGFLLEGDLVHALVFVVVLLGGVELGCLLRDGALRGSSLGAVLALAALVEGDLGLAVGVLEVVVGLRAEGRAGELGIESVDVELVVGGAFLQAVVVGVGRGRVEDDEDVAFFDVVAVFDVDFLDDAFVLDLDGLDLARGDDFAGRDGDFVDVADAGPDDGRRDEGEDGPEDDAACRRGRRFRDFEDGGEEFCFFPFGLPVDELMPELSEFHLFSFVRYASPSGGRQGALRLYRAALSARGASGERLGRRLRRGRGRCGWLGAQAVFLLLVEVAVGAFPGHEFVMGAALDDLAFLDDDDAVGAAHGAETVRDDEHGAALADGVHVVHDGALALVVEGRGRFVEDEDGRVREERARDGDALPLAA